jgi:hypothetical protein
MKMNNRLRNWLGSEARWIAAVAAGGLMAANAAWGQGQGWVGQNDYATPYSFDVIAGTIGVAGWMDGTNGAAEFELPQGIRVGPNGVLYVVDWYNNDVRAVTPVGTNWVVTTIAGTDQSNSGAQEGTNGTIQFNAPVDLAVDQGGSIYVVDNGNHSVRKLTPMGPNWVSSTIATGLNQPYAITIDAATNLYVSDTGDNVIREVSPTAGGWTVTTIAGTISSGGAADGTNGVAQFRHPAGIAVDQAGNLFVGDADNYAVRKITPVGGNWVVTTIAGTLGNEGWSDGTNGDAAFDSSFTPLDSPMAVAVDTNGNVYVADFNNALIRKVSPVGSNWVTTTLAGLYNGIGSFGASQRGTGTNAIFGYPAGIAADASGHLFVVDQEMGVISEGVLFVPPPNPGISRAAAGGVTLWWPGSGITLQTNASLATTNWGTFGGTISNNNGTNSVTVPAPKGNLFFRLSK